MCDVSGLDRLQEIVGGYIEYVEADFRLGDRKNVRASMVVNEEGKIKKLPINHFPTVAVMDYLRQTIHGRVVIFGLPDAQGNETDVPPDMVLWFKVLQKFVEPFFQIIPLS